MATGYNTADVPDSFSPRNAAISTALAFVVFVILLVSFPFDAFEAWVWASLANLGLFSILVLGGLVQQRSVSFPTLRE